ncbi:MULTISPECIES: hypothetical protein [Mesorhizobium]|uniref:Uncharacterized protein n=1 Tax=Mesorhizobium shonense TaxID=1209948 RepID=A0ABV2HZG6_9HYPH|nr:hypothetical protein [Mesorhizobium sp.]
MPFYLYAAERRLADAPLEVAVHQSPGFSLACFAFACAIAVAGAGAAAGGEHGGGRGAGGHHGNDGSHGAGSQHEGRNSGAHKGPGDDPDVSSGDPPPADGTSTFTTGSTKAATAASVVPSADGGQSLDLPPTLQPPGDSTIPSTIHPIEVPGVPDDVVRACYDAIKSAAAPFGPVSVRVGSAGSLHRLSSNTISAPVQVSIDYVHQGRVETRQAPVECELNAEGSVIGLT